MPFCTQIQPPTIYDALPSGVQSKAWTLALAEEPWFLLFQGLRVQFDVQALETVLIHQTKTRMCWSFWQVSTYKSYQLTVCMWLSTKIKLRRRSWWPGLQKCILTNWRTTVKVMWRSRNILTCKSGCFGLWIVHQYLPFATLQSTFCNSRVFVSEVNVSWFRRF